MSEPDAQRNAPSGVFRALTATLALLIALVLQFSALGKLLHPDPNLYFIEPGANGWEDGLLRDYVIAGFEMLFVVVLLLLHRWKYAWAPTSVFFGGLLGYSAYALITGLDCGCFGGLWTPPKGFTVGLNSAFIVGSLLVMLIGRAHKLVLIGTLIATLGAAGFGYYQAGVDRPDPKDIAKERGGGPLGNTSAGGDDEQPTEPTQVGDETSTEGVAPAPAISILEIPALASVMATAPGEQLGYVFLYEDGCSTCENLKPSIEFMRDDYIAQGAPIEIVTIEINDLEREHGIPRLIWASTPTLVAIDGGEIVYYDRGDDVLLPSELFDAWLAGEDLGGRDPADDFGSCRTRSPRIAPTVRA